MANLALICNVTASQYIAKWEQYILETMAATEEIRYLESAHKKYRESGLIFLATTYVFAVIFIINKQMLLPSR